MVVIFINRSILAVHIQKEIYQATFKHPTYYQNIGIYYKIEEVANISFIFQHKFFVDSALY